jgi:Protein of unknown function (DUF2970)
MEKRADMEQTRPMPKTSPFRVMKTVFWSFFGVRRGKDQKDDFAGVTPLQIVVAGVIGAAIFVATLITLVKFITS